MDLNILIMRLNIEKKTEKYRKIKDIVENEFILKGYRFEPESCAEYFRWDNEEF